MVETYLSDRGQDEWLAVVIAIRPNAQVDLVWVVALLESLCDTKDGIGRSQLDTRPPRSDDKQQCHCFVNKVKLSLYAEAEFNSHASLIKHYNLHYNVHYSMISCKRDREVEA